MAGLAQYSEYFNNPLFTKAIKEVPVNPKFIGTRFLPALESYETSWNETIITRQADMADIVASGAELPLTDRDPMKRISGEIVDIGQSYIVTKNELAALMDKGNPGRRTVAEKQLLGKSAMIKQNVDARMEWMRWQALGNGILVYDKAGVKLTVDFGVTVKNTAAIRWDDTAGNPTILSDYEGWVQAYIDKNGMTPDEFVTSTTVIRAVLNDPTIRKQVTGLTDKVITLDELNTFLVGRQMPKMTPFDTSVTYRDVNNNGARTSARLLDSKKGVFLVGGGQIGSQILGPTQENDMNPGIFGHTISLERPRRDIIEVVASSFPKIEDADLISIATVLA